MRNPLIKRLPRELKEDLGKYLVLFLFITGMIAIVSGFQVASGSMAVAYEESFEKYNMEDGNFELAYEAEPELLDRIAEAFAEGEFEGSNLPGIVSIYENLYIEVETGEIDSTLRVFRNREELNLVCLMEGELPKSGGEIAIDRMYAENNELSVGDKLTVDGMQYTITGLVALPDYSALFSSPSDMMFDAVKFGVAVVTEEGFESLGEDHLHYNYSWQYENAPMDDKQAKEWSEELLEMLVGNAVVTGFLPAYSNQAIQFTGNDIGRDKTMFLAFLYIVVVIIAFIFAITTSNTIAKESTVIGTLRASGYSRGELLRHYLTMPLVVTLVSAVIGNALGYTWFKNVAADMYYASYSLPTYVTLWNGEAFVYTTVIPVIIMSVINLVLLADKLKLSPLKFLRRDLSKRKKKKAFRLNTKIGIMKRFRLRIIFQNLPNYITIIIGIFLANIILLFGIAAKPLFVYFQEEIVKHMICEYQYILKMPVETDTKGAEKYCASSLKTLEGKLRSESVTIYGIAPDSAYLDLDLDDEGVYISNAYAEKFGISEGDYITLQKEYEETEYTFQVAGVYEYPAALAVFMSQVAFNETLEQEENYFNGYFSDAELEDVEEIYIANKITEADLTKTSRQMMVSMGSMMDAFYAFGVLMYMLIIYLLSKIIIEKNAQSISMAKILGYTNREVSGLYVMATSLVVIGSLIGTIPIANILLKQIFVVVFAEYSGWLPYYVHFSTFAKMATSGILAYGVIAFLQLRRVKKVPMGLALKNVE